MLKSSQRSCSSACTSKTRTPTEMSPAQQMGSSIQSEPMGCWSLCQGKSAVAEVMYRKSKAPAFTVATWVMWTQWGTPFSNHSIFYSSLVSPVFNIRWNKTCVRVLLPDYLGVIFKSWLSMTRSMVCQFLDTDLRYNPCLLKRTCGWLWCRCLMRFCYRYGIKGAAYLKNKEGLVLSCHNTGKCEWKPGSLQRSSSRITSTPTTGDSITLNLFDHLTVSYQSVCQELPLCKRRKTVS